MRHLAFLIFAALLSAPWAALPAAETAQTGRPNIVIILADDKS
jgi:hypothetical protein